MSIFHHTGCTRYWSIFTVLAVTALLGSTSVQAQHEGVMRLADWPPAHDRQDLDHQILPFIDTLFVSYAFDPSADKPSLSLAVEWLSSGEAIVERKLQRLDEVEGRIRMVALELEAGVFVDDERAATMSIVVDSMQTGPSPDFVRVNFPDLSWSNVFMDVSAEEARSIFAEGFQLRNPEIMHIAFAYYSEREDTGAADPRIRGRERPREVAVYPRHTTVDVVFDLFWLLGGNRDAEVRDPDKPRGAAGRGSLTDSPRSRASGDDRSARDGDPSDRSAESDEVRDRSRDDERSRDRSDEDGRRAGILDMIGSDDDDEDEDDEDDKLVPYAVAAAGAAGLLAVAGGTIGYYGNARYAPYGLTSGLVRQNGGLLLQVAVNEELLSDGDGPKHLTAKLLAFGNLFDGPVQPAFGGGVLATSRGSDVETEPSVSLGAVAQSGPMLFYGGYDVFQQGLEFSMALNIRRLALWGRRQN